MDKRNLQVIRELFGKVVYSHKTHEKECEIQKKIARDVKIGNIAIICLTAGPLLTSLVTNQRAFLIVGSVFSFLGLAFNIFQLSFDPDKKAAIHKNTANELWSIREQFVCLIADIMNENIPEGGIIARRDLMIEELNRIYKKAPNTSPEAYTMARKALKTNDELTFSNDEINHFLPKDLWL